jgi:signal transduction histidine kinase
MAGWLKRILSPPVLGTEEESRIGGILHILILALVTGAIPLIVIGVLSYQRSSVMVITVACVILLFCLLLTHRGFLRISSYLMPLTVLVLNTYLLWNGQGIHDIALVSYAIVLALAGLLLGKWGPIIFAVLSAMSITLVAIGEVAHRVKPDWAGNGHVGISDVANISIMLSLTAVLISVSSHSLLLSLKRARQNEEALRLLNVELDRRVAERTAELQAANEHLQVLGRMKDDLVTNVSHELRTPLTSMKLYHYLLGRAPEKSSDYLDRLARETQRLETLIEDLLSLSRLDQERIEFSFVPTDLNTLVAEFVTDRALLVKSKGLNLVLETVPGALPVNVDRVWCGHVLGILLTNACAYTPAGGHVRVTTQCRECDGQRWAGFSVSDTGPGILPDEQDRLFTRFFRGKVGLESGAAGTGLGLATAKEIVERHRGQIETVPPQAGNGGATFNVWLPVEIA